MNLEEQKLAKSAYDRDYRKRNRIQIAQRRLSNLERLREQGRVRSKKRRMENPEAERAKARARYTKNMAEKLEFMRARVARYARVARQDPQVRLRGNLRTRVRAALRRGTKSGATIALLGCPIEALYVHLESKFQPGMSWKNYGEWHVDHIRPCAKFDLISPEEQRKCFHWTNLQPLWAEDNLRKGAK